MTTDSGKKLRDFWIDPNYCDEDVQNVFDAFSEKPTQGPSQWIYNLIHVREVGPCPNCERLEASKHIQTSGMETEIQRLQKQLEMCKEALTLIAAPKRNDGTHNRCREACEQLAVKCLKAIDKEFGE